MHFPMQMQTCCRCRHVHRIIILRNHTTTSTTICWVPCHLYLFFMSNRADPMFGEPIWSHQSHHVRGLAERCRWKRLSPGSFMQLQGDKFQRKWDFALWLLPNWFCKNWCIFCIKQVCHGLPIPIPPEMWLRNEPLSGAGKVAGTHRRNGPRQTRRVLRKMARAAGDRWGTMG